ncbi:MAG: hypothetical protein FWG90_07205 [Oscillospiraceae bacterium]|nr:hypothetical protein [Oscillospiraceae bacterium]
MKSTKAAIITIAAVTYSVLLIMFTEIVGDSVRNAVALCLTTVIPALFAFMVLCEFLISSGLYKALRRPFAGFSRYVFRIEPELFPVFLLSSVAGYPIGAKLLDKLYRKKSIDKKTAEDMLCYCYLGGPAFICGVAGANLFGGIIYGLIIFFSIFLSNIIIGFALGLGRKVPHKRKLDNAALKEEIGSEDMFSVFTSSVILGARSVFAICAMIVFFSSVTAILEGLGVFSFLSADSRAIAKSMIEISNIKELTAGNLKLLPIAASLLSFGGICVITQIKSFLHKSLSMKNFYFSRFASILSSYLCSKIVMNIVLKQEAVQTLNTASGVSAGSRYVSPLPAVFLLIMTVMLLSNRKDGRE